MISITFIIFFERTMFIKNKDLIDKLLECSPPFKYLYKKYEKLEAQIMEMESAVEMHAAHELELLKAEKQHLHQEIHSALTQITNYSVTS